MMDHMFPRKEVLPRAALGYGDYDTVLDVLSEAVKSGPYIVGEQFTAADVMMTFPFTMTRQFVPVDVASHPAMAAYVERMEARPAYQRCRAIVDRVPSSNA